MKQPRTNHVYRFAPFSLESLLFNGLFALHEIAEQDIYTLFLNNLKKSFYKNIYFYKFLST